MTSFINKYRFLLFIFLLFPAAIQCMEKAVIIKPKTIQDIQNDRDNIIKNRLHSTCTSEWPFDGVFFQECWSSSLKQLEKSKDLFDTLEIYKGYRDKQYSLLGIATIAIKIDKDPQPEIFYNKAKCIPNLRNKTVQEQPSFIEKKFFIQKLLKFLPDPTPEDKELALLMKYEEFAPSIIKMLCFLQHSPLLSEMSVPQELIHYIPLLIWETEESLL